MGILTLVFVFLSAIAVAAGVVRAFSAAIDAVLIRLLAADLAAAWSQYTQFAVFVASFVAGLRLNELSSSWEAAPALPMEKCLLDVFKTIAGALSGAEQALLLFFGATLIAYAGNQVYVSLKPALRPTSPQDTQGSGRLLGRP